MRVLELYAGIGGLAQALPSNAKVVAAIDHNQHANQVYKANFNHRLLVKNLETIRDDLLESLPADLWWMSPPCQPYTIRGTQRDLDDPRSRSYIRILSAIDKLRPPFIAMENVPWFQGSRGHALLLETLNQANYTWREGLLCPSEFGVPNIRKRFYLVASRSHLHPLQPARKQPVRLQQLICSTPPEGTALDADLLTRFGSNLHVVDAEDPNATTACFTSAYTNSPVHAGSYLRQNGLLRAFSPHEILRILGFPNSFVLPNALNLRQQYKLVGNSLALAPVQHILKTIPTLAGPVETI